MPKSVKVSKDRQERIAAYRQALLNSTTSPRDIEVSSMEFEILHDILDAIQNLGDKLSQENQ